MPPYPRSHRAPAALSKQNRQPEEVLTALLHEHLIIVADGQLSITNIFHETWQPVALSDDEAECTCVSALKPAPVADGQPSTHCVAAFVAGYSNGYIALWHQQADSKWFCTKVELPPDMVVNKMVTWQQFVIWLDKRQENIFATDVHTGNHIRVNKEKVCAMVVCHNKGLVYTTYEGDLFVHELGGGWTHLLTVKHLIVPGLSCLVVCGSQIVCGGKVSNDLG